jgi:cytidylate kinase|tara:strand:- start:65 stop:733 length:669 start_codon:yes stop_codon:yes gene_type:complete
MKFNNLITIDGLSGAGKGTLALNLAHEFNYGILDSGALYRLVGLVSQRMDSKDPEIIEKEIGSKKIAMNLNPKLMETEIFFGTENVTKLLKSDEIANEASNFAADKKIREILKNYQKNFYDPELGLVADGRDMGTVIFPEAKWKFFLIASIEERAKRREEQLKDIGLEVNIATLVDSIMARDSRDTNRDVSPAIPAEDAITIDSSNLSIEELKKKILGIVKT